MRGPPRPGTPASRRSRRRELASPSACLLRPLLLMLIGASRAAGANSWKASLFLRSLSVQDETPYECEFVTFPQGILKASTRLHVLGSSAGTLEVPKEVLGFLGANTTLGCHLQLLMPSTKVTQVSWHRPAGSRITVAMMLHNGKTSISDPDKMGFVVNGPGANSWNASLFLRSLSVQDETSYECEFVTFPQGILKASTRLRVLAKPQDQAEALEVSGPLGLEPVPVARCLSAAGHPPANISWSLPKNWRDWKTNMSQAPGHLPGTLSVTSVLLVVPSSQMDHKNVTCVVDHDSFESPHLLPVTITVHYPPEVTISGYDGNWYLGRSEVTLNCDVRSNPEPTDYHWNTTTGPLPPSAVAQGHQLLIHTVDLSINCTILCHATNVIGTGQAELTILVRDRQEQRSLGLLAGISITGIVLLVTVMAVVYLRKRNRQNLNISSPPNGDSARNGIHYTSMDLETNQQRTQADSPM